VARRVLGGVVEQTQNGARKPLAPDGARDEQRVRRGRADLVERPPDGRAGVRDESRRARGWLAGITLAAHRVQLLLAEVGAARVSQQAIQHAGHVLQVEADRRRPSGSRPERVGREVCDFLDVPSDLHQRVCDTPSIGPPSQASGALLVASLLIESQWA
jgi:hypothetical protein